MMDRSNELLSLLAKLVAPERRSDGVRTLAHFLGAEDLFLFIADPEVKELLPAPGFAQTLPGGRSWHEFLSHCEQGLHRGTLPWPRLDSPAPAIGIGCRAESAVILVGGNPSEKAVRDLALHLPLLAAALRGERAVAHCAAEARLAQKLAQQARELAIHLDQARHAAQEEIIARRIAEAEVRELNQTLERRVQD